MILWRARIHWCSWDLVSWYCITICTRSFSRSSCAHNTNCQHQWWSWHSPQNPLPLPSHLLMAQQIKWPLLNTLFCGCQSVCLSVWICLWSRLGFCAMQQCSNITEESTVLILRVSDSGSRGRWNSWEERTMTVVWVSWRRSGQSENGRGKRTWHKHRKLCWTRDR